MDTSSELFELIRDVLVQLPSLLTMIGCMAAAMILWKRHPKVSLTIVIGLTLLFLQAFIFSFVYAFVPDFFARPADFSAQQTVASVISFFYHSVRAVGLAVILVAVFMRRSMPPRRSNPIAAPL